MPELEPAQMDPDLMVRLGNIVVRWSLVEEWLSHLLTGLVDADPGGMQIVTTNVANSTQIQWILTLLSVHIHKQPELQEIIDLVKRADEMRGERNAFMHGLWNPVGCEPGTCLVSTAKWERAEIVRNWLVTTTDLDEFHNLIDEWLVEFQDVGRQFGFPRRRGETKSIFAD
jgi:hypothetical protein